MCAKDNNKTQENLNAFDTFFQININHCIIASRSTSQLVTCLSY